MSVNAKVLIRIKMTPGLEAAIGVMSAQRVQRMSQGKYPLVNPADAAEVRDALLASVEYLKDPDFFSEDEPVADSLAAMQLIIDLATLYREHILAGNQS